MDKDKEKNNMRPPYSSTGHAEEILNLFRKITPKKIDSKFIVDNKITTPTNASTVVNFAKWMGIIDLGGEVNKEISNKLNLIGEARRDFIKKLIENSYKEVFENINLNEASRENITNFFVNRYGYGSVQAKSATILFLHLCQKYGIPMSEELKKKTHTNLENKKIKKPISRKKRNRVVDEIPSKSIQEIEEGKLRIIIQSKTTSFEREFSSKREIENFLEKEFKIRMESFKLDLLDEIKEDENETQKS